MEAAKGKEKGASNAETLIEAAAKGDIDGVKKLLESGADHLHQVSFTKQEPLN